MTTRLKLTMGPVLFNWEPDAWRDFYFRIADEAPVDRSLWGRWSAPSVMPFFDDHFPAVMERLTAAGKEVVVSSLAPSRWSGNAGARGIGGGRGWWSRPTTSPLAHLDRSAVCHRAVCERL